MRSLFSLPVSPLLVTAALLALASAPAHAQIQPIQPIQALDTGNGFLSQTGGSNTLGWSFTLGPNATITVTQLGIFDDNRTATGLDNAHQVGLWTSTGELLTSTTIGPGLTGTAVASTSGRGSFRYVDAPNVVLTPGTYVLGASYTRFETDQFLADTSSVTLAPGLAFNSGQIGAGGFVFPSSPATANGNAFFGPNFRFTPGGTVPAAVPEPSEWLTMGLAGTSVMGLMVRARRRKSSAAS